LTVPYRTVRTGTLEIAYQEYGPAGSPAVVLLHGWPSDVHDWDDVAPVLGTEGFRVLVPWLRGFGPTRFLNPATPRSGQQAALGADLRDFLDALDINQAVLAGYDWGGRAACVVAVLWPERVKGLVSITGYNIQNIPASRTPAHPVQEHRFWYQWYFQTERGRAGLSRNRRELPALLWRLWSPNWRFDDALLDATATSFDNPDFVDVTIQSYRHRYGNAPGDPAFEDLERRLAARPAITVPTIVLHGDVDGVTPASESARHAKHFTGSYTRHVVPLAGHFLPREAPGSVVAAVKELARAS
jgi:pimeloyl-ACP methyl ester carboxylesterase